MSDPIERVASWVIEAREGQHPQSDAVARTPSICRRFGILTPDQVRTIEGLPHPVGPILYWAGGLKPQAPPE